MPLLSHDFCSFNAPPFNGFVMSSLQPLFVTITALCRSTSYMLRWWKPSRISTINTDIFTIGSIVNLKLCKDPLPGCARCCAWHGEVTLQIAIAMFQCCNAFLPPQTVASPECSAAFDTAVLQARQRAAPHPVPLMAASPITARCAIPWSQVI